MNDLEMKKETVLKAYEKYTNAMKVRTLKHGGLDIVEGRREGAYVWDITGKRYIDCITGAGIFNVGRRNKFVIDTLKQALDEVDIGVFLFFSEDEALLSHQLVEIAPYGINQVVYGTGGGEANDFALKLARGYTRRSEVISMSKAYHGHTGFSLSAVGRDAYKSPFVPLMPGFRQIPFNDSTAAQAEITDKTAAVILEPIQGEGGINIPDDSYLWDLRRICDATGAMLIFDEIQTGWGRTGKLFASEHWGVVPDIMTVAKSMSGGIYPISATLYKEKLSDFMFAHPFVHFSTFGGSDLGCRVARATIQYILENKLSEHAAEMGDRFQLGFDRFVADYPDILKETRRKGLMMGLEYTEDSLGPRMSAELSERGVIAVYTSNDPKVMRLMPSLVVTESDVDFILTALDESMKAVREKGIHVQSSGAEGSSTPKRRRPGK